MRLLDSIQKSIEWNPRVSYHVRFFDTKAIVVGFGFKISRQILEPFSVVIVYDIGKRFDSRNIHLQIWNETNSIKVFFRSQYNSEYSYSMYDVVRSILFKLFLKGSAG